MDDPATTRDDGALFGVQVAAAGDYDGDTLADVLVAAPRWNASQGGVLLYHGRATPPATVTVPGDWAAGFSGDRWLTTTVSAELFGNSIAAAGRIDGDALDDVVIGAPADTTTTGGAVYLSSGRTRAGGGLTSTTRYEQQLLSPTAGVASVNFGGKVALALINSDSVPDLLVYSDYPPGGTADNQGSVLVYLTSAGRFGATYAGMIRNDAASAGNDALGNYLATGVFKRSSVLSDLDGDGRSDVLVGMWRLGGVGSAGMVFMRRDFATTVLASSADLTVRADAGDTVSHGSVGYIGDVNGDGWSDWAVGHTRHSSGRGRMIILY